VVGGGGGCHGRNGGANGEGGDAAVSGDSVAMQCARDGAATPPRLSFFSSFFLSSLFSCCLRSTCRDLSIRGMWCICLPACLPAGLSVGRSVGRSVSRRQPVGVSAADEAGSSALAVRVCVDWRRAGGPGWTGWRWVGCSRRLGWGMGPPTADGKGNGQTGRSRMEGRMGKMDMDVHGEIGIENRD
jgi:hypothetical protein